MRRTLFSLGLVLAVALPARAQEAPKPVVVPFETLPSGHMTIMVKVNGKGPYKLIFDTGAPLTLVNTKLADESGVMKAGAKQGFSLLPSAQQVKIKEIDINGLKVEEMPAVVMDHPTVKAISDAFEDKAGPIYGIVGFPFFARYKMTLDYKARTLTFVPNGYKPPDVMVALMAELTRSETGPKMLAPAALWGLTAAKADGDEKDGVDVKEVRPGSPAALGGLKPGDRLLTLDGRWTDTLADLYAAAGVVQPGKEVAVKVLRDGKEMTLKVKPVSGL
jgi:hypothetical protein